MIVPGFYRMSNAAYHEAEGLSSTILRRFHYYSPLHSTVPGEETEAKEFGGMFHEAVEDPIAFEKKYVILPDDCRPGSGTGMKARKETFEAETERNSQAIIKNQGDYDNIRGMAAAIHGHPECLALMDGDCVKELTGYWIDPETGLLCKCRVDLLNKTKGILVDWKSCIDARPGPWCKKAWDLGYHLQAAWYLWGVSMIAGIEHDHFIFVAVEKKPPYGIQIYPAMPDLLKYSRTICRGALDRYAQYLKEDEWPCYTEMSPGFDLPTWKRRELTIYD